MQYENLFWGMAAVVVVALVGGALCGRCRTVGRSLAGVVAVAAAMLVTVALLAHQAQLGKIVVLLSVAAFMFCLVIGTAVTLLTRRLRQR